MTRNIRAKIIVQKVKEAYRCSCLYATKELLELLRKALSRETNKQAKKLLRLIMENCRIARSRKRPICQDTGLAVVFAEIGEKVVFKGSLERAINKGVAAACRENYLRESVVDPLTRKPTSLNTPAIIHPSIIPGAKLRLTIIPKGFGSENMGQVIMLKPSDGIEGIIDFVVAAVKKAGANPCPPILAGVGIGGTLEKAALLAKEALFTIGLPRKKDPLVKRLEIRLLKEINKLNIGPAGLGGKTTALQVQIKTFPTHLAGLPVAVNIGCWCHRAETIVL